ncbi:hypothetical protein PtB15_4B741 [Puccinia triticina]|nr:hypothetical protein PtB15_4B741 [Puccinia triticina]
METPASRGVRLPKTNNRVPQSSSGRRAAKTTAAVKRLSGIGQIWNGTQGSGGARDPTRSAFRATKIYQKK